MGKTITIKNVIEKLKEKTLYDKNTGCWLHQSVDLHRGGYARIRFNYRDTDVHRIAAHVYHGLDLNDKSIQANHKSNCPNRNCWNPEHVYIGTQQDNVNDAMQNGTHRGAINAMKIHCPQGHLYDGTNSEGKRICSICEKIANDKAIIHYRMTR